MCQKNYKSGIMNDLNCGNTFDDLIIFLLFLGMDPKFNKIIGLLETLGNKMGDKGYIRIIRGQWKGLGTYGIAI